MGTVVGGKAREQRQPLLGGANEAVVTVAGDERITVSGASVGAAAGDGDGEGKVSSSAWGRSPAGVVAVACAIALGVVVAGVISLDGGMASLGGMAAAAAALGDPQQKTVTETPQLVDNTVGGGSSTSADLVSAAAAADASLAEEDYSEDRTNNNNGTRIPALGGVLERMNRRMARALRRKARLARRAEAEAEAAAVAAAPAVTATTTTTSSSTTTTTDDDDDDKATMEKKITVNMRGGSGKGKDTAVAGVGATEKETKGEGGVDNRANVVAETGNDEKCKIIYYYHIPKTGGGSLVRYFGHTEGVKVLRYESTMYVPPENKELYYWEHASNDAHWDNYIVPQALGPGLKFIAHHWGRYGMLQMHKKLDDLREKAAKKGCEFMASTTFREPVQRDVSDEVFRRITGVTAYHYLGDEQLRFLLINSQHTSPLCVEKFQNRPEQQKRALEVSKRFLKNQFELVAVIDDLEQQKNAFLEFFGFPTTPAEIAAAEKKNGKPKAPSSSGGEYPESAHLGQAPDALGHVHKIDYAKQISEKEMEKLKNIYKSHNALDMELYNMALELSRSNPMLGKHRKTTTKAVSAGEKVVPPKKEKEQQQPPKEPNIRVSMSQYMKG